MATGAPDYGQYIEDYTEAGKAYAPYVTYRSIIFWTKTNGSWARWYNASMLSSFYLKGVVAGNWMEMTFNGSLLGVEFDCGNDGGIAAVSVDGGTEVLYDTYDSEVSVSRMPILFTDLSDEEHTVRIRVTGSKNASSSGIIVRPAGILIDGRRNPNIDPAHYNKTLMEYLASEEHGLHVQSDDWDYPLHSWMWATEVSQEDSWHTARTVCVDASGHLQVDVLTAPSVTVTATNLDIRDLTYATDSVTAYQGGTWSAGRTWTLASGTDSISAVQSGAWNIGTVTTVTGITNTVTVTATHLDIRHLNSTDDTVNAVESGTWTFIKAATTPNEYNITMTNADTEYSKALLANTKKFMLRVRDGTAARYAFTTGKVAGSTSPYFTLGTGEVYWEEGLNLSSKTIYFACSSAGKVVELLAWS